MKISGFANIDQHVAEALLRLSQQDDPHLRRAIQLLSYHTRAGHVCIDLLRLPEQSPEDESVPFTQAAVRRISKNPLVGTDRQDHKPLVLADETRLYFRRFRQYELRTAARLRNLAMHAGPADDVPLTDAQERAAALAVTRRLVVVTGGPGTGKTTTVARILARLLEEQPDARVLLAAPTGKAAMRLRESLDGALERLGLSEEERSRIPEVSTLHRLLGSRQHSARFLRDSHNPLPCELLIVDEASMIDLPMFAALLEALPTEARLVLAGDRYQLASVEAGTVLGDICSVADEPALSGGIPRTAKKKGRRKAPGPADGDGLFGGVAALRSSIVELDRNYRFSAESGIAQLAGAVREGDTVAARSLLEGSLADLAYLGPGGESELAEEAERALREAIVDGFRPLGKAQSPGQCLEALDRFRLLCAHRRGPGGVYELGALVSSLLLEAGVLRRARGAVGGLEPLPILVLRNDYRLRLYNGDVGILLHDDEGRPRVHFRGSEADSIRAIPPERLPEHEVSFAMTVHKSQGSEFDRTLLVLPPQPSPILTRQLLYTAITRAREQFLLFGRPDLVELAVQSTLQRTSGLRTALIR